MSDKQNIASFRNDNEDGYWGIFRRSVKTPQVRWDPFRTIKNKKGTIVGHRVHFSSLRGNRPHEFTDNQTSPPVSNQKIHEDDTFCRLSRGELPSIVLSTDNHLQKNPFSIEPSYENLSQSTAFTLINMYTPMTRVLLSKKNIGPTIRNSVTGIPLVHILTKHYQSLEEVPINELTIFLENTILTVNEAISELKKTTSVPNNIFHFYNIGARSGSSIPHLHSQTLIFKDQQGHGWKEHSFLETYNLNKSKSKGNNYCLGCLYQTFIRQDHLSQELNIKERLVWENKHFMAVTAFAPEHDGQIRIIPKQHTESIWTLTKDNIESLAEMLSVTNAIMSKFIEQHGSNIFLTHDRNIIFHQRHPQNGIDTHLIIDIIPFQRVGGAERLDDYKISQIMPEEVAQKMKKKLSEITVL